MVARQIFEKCTVARLGVPCGLTRHPLVTRHGKMATNMIDRSFNSLLILNLLVLIITYIYSKDYLSDIMSELITDK